MTERFTINKSRLVANSFVIDDKEKQYTFSTVEYHKEFLNSFCKALNELHEENQSSKEFIEQLQEELMLFKNAGANMGIDLNNQITALKKENEQLKKQREELFIREKDTKNDLKELKQKNEELKQEIETLQEQIAHFDIGDVE